MKVQLEKNRSVYNITFDEYGDLDTVECNGKFLSTKNAVVKSIMSNAEKIKRGNIPAGFTKVGR